MMSTVSRKADGRLLACVVLMSAFLAAFSSCSSDVGKVKTKTLTIKDMTLSWTAPTTYNDGSGLTVSSYKLYYGTSVGSFPASTTISGSATTYDAAQVVTTRGVTYYFALSALDASLYESEPSNVVSAYVQN
jgi:hypothetical protein